MVIYHPVLSCSYHIFICYLPFYLFATEVWSGNVYYSVAILSDCMDSNLAIVVIVLYVLQEKRTTLRSTQITFLLFFQINNEQREKSQHREVSVASGETLKTSRKMVNVKVKQKGI